MRVRLAPLGECIKLSEPMFKNLKPGFLRNGTPQKVFWAVMALACVISFQNCSEISTHDSLSQSVDMPSREIGGENLNELAEVLLTPDSNMVLEGQMVGLTVTFKNAKDVIYYCLDNSNGDLIQSGQISSSGERVTLLVDRNLLCRASAIAMVDRHPISNQSRIEVVCSAGRTKNPSTEQCE